MMIVFARVLLFLSFLSFLSSLSSLSFLSLVSLSRFSLVSRLVVEDMYLRVLEKGAPLFVQGQEPDAHCVLMSGGVDLYILPDGPPGSQARPCEGEGGARGRGGSVATTCAGLWARRFDRGAEGDCGAEGPYTQRPSAPPPPTRGTPAGLP